MNLNFKVYGTGQPIVILHGLLGSLDNWQTIAKALSEDYSVYVVDQRNHGKSPHDEQFDYDVLVSDLVEFFEQERISKAHVIGHSMGGKVAMKFALEEEDYVDKLVVVDMSPSAYEGGHQLIFEALMQADLDKQKRSEIEEQLMTNIPEFGVRQFLMKGLYRNEEKKFAWRFDLDSIWQGYPNILSAISNNNTSEHDSLFVAGGKSDYVQDSHTEPIQALFPNSKIEVITEAGHWVHAEAPKAFLDVVMEFLASE